MAYRKDAWSLMGSDILVDVAEDQPGLWGRRTLLLARFQHKASGKTVLLANHHGPLVVGSGGICGGKATAWNILRAIAEHVQADDSIVLMGDFNAEAHSEAVRTLDDYLNRHYTGVSFNGVDHIFSSCDATHIKEKKNLGGGGSDHDALAEIMTI
uniref:Endonuclease/exonuclease/phosphatase domain-containing protein n=1 Tax=Spumella elongata TaxID=89044 RepID=A0A7S3M5T9_9STRA